MSVRTELAWAAGFFDGEGTTCVKHQKNKRTGERKGYLYVCIGQTDKRPLERFMAAVGMGHVNGPYQRKAYGGIQNIKPMWMYGASERDGLRLLLKLSAYLSEQKREQALGAMTKVRARRAGIAVAT